MEEEKVPLVGDGGDSSRTSSSFMKKGDRQMFTVELRPAETTIVSWRKLMKDSSKVNGSNLIPEHPPVAHPTLESRIAPGQPPENEANDGAFPHRFSAVIEKIERLYMGKDSSDDEDLRDIPDDDQYDTEDSFIDDAELDEYFEVDNSAIKHDGFFVNRGKLERINEPLVLPNQQPKKRRRKDVLKNSGDSYEGQESNKHGRVGKAAAGKAASLPVKKTSNSSQNLPASIEHYDDLKIQNQLVSCSKKNIADPKPVLNPAVSLNASKDDAPPTMIEAKDIDKQNVGNLQSRNANDKFKDASGSVDACLKEYYEKRSYAISKSQPGRPASSSDGMENRVQSKEKNGICELPDLNLTDGRTTMQATKLPYTHKKEGTSVRPKTSMLEKAIRELEKMVAESRPPAAENQEADTTSQAVKRRLPREIKLKLSKVARLAQASHGKVSKELINRLMSILGHLIQLRTLKRHLKIMISMGLSAKQEKDARFQSIKKEVVEMIKIQAPHLEPKQQQQASASGGFQEFGSDAKASEKRMDAALEDRICDLYDLFVDGLDDDAGPQIRKLYAELAELWPNGYMDNRGIKKAICRAKERRKALHMRHKDHDKVKNKKMLASQQETVRLDPCSVASQQNTRERLASESGTHAFTSANKPVSNTINTIGGSGPLVNGPKQEKVKGSSTILEDVRVADLTKKVKRKPELEYEVTESRPEKLASVQGEERSKPSKQSSSLSHKSNIQPTSLPGVEQSS